MNWSDELGRELRETPLPTHRPDYFQRVRERMRLADSTGGARRRTPDPSELPAQPSPSRHRLGSMPNVRFVAVISAAAAIVAAVAVSWTGVPGITSSEPAQATADTVLTRVQNALSGLSTIRGEVVEYGTARGHPYEHKVGSFAFTARGDYRIVQHGSGTAYTYDAKARVARRYVIQDGKASYGEIASGLPDSGPFFSPWMGVSQVLDRSVAAYARAVIADLDPNVPVTPVTYEGRTAWSVTVPERLTGGSALGTVRIVVDSASGYPLAVEHWSSDGTVSGTRVEHIKVGRPVTQDDLTLVTTGQTELLPDNEGFRRLTLAEATELSGRLDTDASTATDGDDFNVYLPSWIPEGFKLTGITGAVNDSYLSSSTAVGDGEIASLTVVLTYSRGFDRFCVVSRWRSENRAGSDDPFDENSATVNQSTVVPLTGGGLNGKMGRVVIGLSDWPHIFVSTGKGHRLSVSVAGDLTRSELTAIANSLLPAGH